MWCDVWRGKYFIMSLARPDILSGARSARYYAMKFNQTAAGRGSLTHSGLKRNCVRWLGAVTPLLVVLDVSSHFVLFILS